MKKYRIKGMLAGDKIDIRCTKNQALVLRARLVDYLDEHVISKRSKTKSYEDKIEEINDKRFLTGIDRHRGMVKDPDDMIRGGG